MLSAAPYFPHANVFAGYLDYVKKQLANTLWVHNNLATDQEVAAYVQEVFAAIAKNRRHLSEPIHDTKETVLDRIKTLNASFKDHLLLQRYQPLFQRIVLDKLDEQARLGLEEKHAIYVKHERLIREQIESMHSSGQTADSSPMLNILHIGLEFTAAQVRAAKQ